MIWTCVKRCRSSRVPHTYWLCSVLTLFCSVSYMSAVQYNGTLCSRQSPFTQHRGHSIAHNLAVDYHIPDDLSQHLTHIHTHTEINNCYWFELNSIWITVYTGTHKEATQHSYHYTTVFILFMNFILSVIFFVIMLYNVLQIVDFFPCKSIFKTS